MMIDTPPTISITLPIRNEADFIQRGLAALLSQDYTGSMEILIADGMSTDDTREKIHSLIASFSASQPSVILIDNPGKIVPTGINIALRQSKGDIIIRVDGHTIISPDYVRQCVDALQRTNADNVGGRMNAISTTPFGEAVALATSTSFGIGGGRFHYSDLEEQVDTVYMGAWHRQVFEKNGLFDEELVRDQDDEFNYRLLENGGRILLCPGIKSEYTVRSSPLALWKQYYQYGFWKVRVFQKHPRQMRMRQFVPPVFALALILSILLAFSVLVFPISIPFTLLLSFLLPLLYILVNIFASLSTARKHGWEYLTLLPFIFAILHLSYGSGFLVGLIKFAGRWGDRAGHVPPFHPSLQ